MARTLPGQGWFRVRHALITHPRVLRIADRLHDPDATNAMDFDTRVNIVLGALCRVFSMGNLHADRYGRIECIDLDTISRIAGVAGFGEAMEGVGWLETYDGGVILPRFDKHNDPLTRQDVGIDTGSNRIDDTGSTRDRSIKEREREREQEKGIYVSIDTNVLDDQVDQIWTVWPRKDNKVKGVLAIQKVLRSGYPFDELLRRVTAFAATRPRSRKDAQFEFTPHPSTWFNDKEYLNSKFDPGGEPEPVNPYDAHGEDG